MPAIFTIQAIAGCNNGIGYITGSFTADLEDDYTVTLTTSEDTEFSRDGGTFGNAGTFAFYDLPNHVYSIRVQNPLGVGRSKVLTIACAVVEVPETPVYDCVATYPFTIDTPRGPRFFMQQPDYHGRVHRTEWMQKGYTGTPEELRGGANPVRISYPGTGNKVDVVQGSGISFELVVSEEGLLKKLYTVDEREYRVDHYIDGELVWQGYHMADVYTEPLVSFPFTANVQAYDGLGALDNIYYLKENGERYYGRARSIDVLFRCLRLLDLELPVWLAVNVWEDTMDLSIEPLSQSYVDQGAYYNEDNEALSCKEVLIAILQPYNAILRQAQGGLHILRIDEQKGAYVRRMASIGKIDALVDFDLETETFEEVYTILRNDEVSYRNNAQVVDSRPAYKYVTIVTEYGPYENFIFNGDFERWVNDTPLFWEKSDAMQITRIAEDDKFVLGVTPTVADNPSAYFEKYLRYHAYQFPVFSTYGFTVKFDYTIDIDDFLPKEGMDWIEFPEFTLEGGVFTLTNLPLPCQASFNGVTVAYAFGAVRSGIPGTTSQYSKRTDVVYALADGTMHYVLGEETHVSEDDTIIEEPADALLVTYVTWEGNTPHFSSTTSGLQVEFPFSVGVGDYGMTIIKGRNRSTFTPEDDPESRKQVARWVDAANPRTITRFIVGGLKSDDGYTSKSGTCVLHSAPMLTPGIPRLVLYAPILNRENFRGVRITIDNVSFTEREDATERFVVEGENEGHINTEPFELTLHHGSGIPRTEALLTLADGTPTQTWNKGYLLQELTARNILSQHQRATLVLSAHLDGPVSPLSILKDPTLPGSRFFVDKYTYNARTGITEIEAYEIFGGVEDVLSIPDKAMLYEDGTPMLYEDGTFMLYE